MSTPRGAKVRLEDDLSDSDNSYESAGDMTNPGDPQASGSGNRPGADPVEFEDVNEADGPEVLNKLANITVPWDKDVNYFFFDLEMRMELVAIRSQWYKRIVLANNLPPQVRPELKSLLKKNKAQAGNTIYRDLKYKVIELFGPREEEAFEAASQLIMTGKPSAFAKELVDHLCKCDPPLQCCAAPTVSALWRRQLPPVVRAAIAGKSLSTHFADVIKLADDVHASQATGAANVAAVAAAVDEDVAAFKQPNKQKPRGGGTAGRGQNSRRRGKRRGGNNSSDRGERHESNPPPECCRLHWQHGPNAYYCLNKATCPMKDQCSPPQE